MNKIPSVVICDLGNVLAFFDRRKTYNRFAEYLPHTAEEIGEKIEASGLRQQFELGKLDETRFFLQVMNLFDPPHELDYEPFCQFWGDIFATNRAFLKTLEKLDDSVVLVLLSNTNSLHFESIEKKHPEILEFFGDRVVLSYRANLAKPDPELFRQALAAAGGDYDFSDCLFVDDVAEHVEAAERLGMTGHHYVGLYDFVLFLRKIGLLIPPTRH